MYLHKGVRNEDVKAVQTMLNQLGYDVGYPDGIFGNMTDKAVRAFQKDYKLYIDGIVGCFTYNKLSELTTPYKEINSLVQYNEYISGGQTTYVIKCRPEDIRGIILLGDTLHHAKINGVNAGYFPFAGDRKAPENCWSLAVTDRKPIGPNSHIVSWNPKVRRGVIAYDNNNMINKRINHYQEIPNMLWGISGMDLLHYDMQQDAFGKDVYSNGATTMLGYDKNQNVYMVVRSHSTIKRQIETARNLDLIAAIRLDCGGSSQINYNGRGYKSSRKVNTAMALKG